jgi:DNA (cytosine-5)-methyltransferase 3A
MQKEIKNVLGLFDGMSCGQIALNKVGIKYDNYYASEIDVHAIKVTQHNYPNTIQLGDIHNIKGSDLPKIDLLFGGSPCQSFSSAGNRTGFDGKSGLFWEFVRVLNEVQPKYFLLENVKMKKEWEDIITKEMGVEPIRINSNLVSGQNRERLYWTNIPNLTQPEDKNIKLSENSRFINSTNAENSLGGFGFGLMINGASSVFFMKQLDFLLLGIDQLVNTYNIITNYI